MKGPDRSVCSINEPTVYLEMYYKRGEWALSQNGSTYIDDAMIEVKRELGEEEWNDLSPEEQKDEAMRWSKRNIENQQGWGVVTEIAGTIVAEGEPRY